MRKAIGILGGMGPEASVYMYKMLIDLSIEHFDAKNNDEFPEIILYSIPVPDFISSDKRKEEALIMLKERVRQLNKLPISCIGIACNTAHVLLNDLILASSTSFVSIIDEVVEQVRRDKKKIIGLVGTPSTIRFGLYQSALERYSIKTLVPSESQKKILERIIRNVIRGKTQRKDTRALIKIANSLKKRGAEGIILGCTELPLVFPKKYSISFYNSVEILAMSLLRNFYK